MIIRNVFKLLQRMLLLIILACSFIACRQSTSMDLRETQVTQVSVLDKIKTAGVIRVGTTGDFMPFSYKRDGQPDTYQGVDIRMAEDLAKSLDVELQLVPTSWPTLMEDLLSNHYDICMSGVTIKLDRQAKAIFSIPLLQSGKAAITRDENVSRFKRLESINQPGVKLIVNPGGTNESFARANFPNATIVENEDNLSIFQKIVDGKVDLMVTDAVETLIQEQIHPELESVNPDQTFNFFEMGYLMPRDLIFKAYVDQWLNLRLKDGSFQDIFDSELKAISDRY